MSRKHVLMLGPGEPSILNSGLGKAAQFLADCIADDVKLTIVEPEKLDDFKNTLVERDFSPKYHVEHYSNVTQEISDYHVLADIARMEISNAIAPYWYNAGTYEVNREYRVPIVQEKVEQFTKEIIEKVDLLEYDLVYAHDWLTFMAAMAIKEKLNVPLILHIHSLEHDRNPNADISWVFELEQDAMNVADRVICVSYYSKSIIQAVYGIDGDKVEVVHNGYQEHHIPKHPNPFKEKVVLFVGRLTNQKGPTQFLKIAEHVHRHYPNSRFIMAGDGDLYQSLIEAGAHSSIASRFHMTGHLSSEELDKLYSMADVYCMPSVSEPFGLTALEAAGAGLPMVISKTSGAAEVLDGAINVNWDDTIGFANEIVKLLKNEKMKHYYITKNQKAVHALTWKHAANKITNIFHTV